jgi:hypothetical protein
MNGRGRRGFPDFMQQYKEGVLLGIKQRQEQMLQDQEQWKRTQQEREGLLKFLNIFKDYISPEQLSKFAGGFGLGDVEFKKPEEGGPKVTQKRGEFLKDIPILQTTKEG